MMLVTLELEVLAPDDFSAQVSAVIDEILCDGLGQSQTPIDSDVQLRRKLVFGQTQVVGNSGQPIRLPPSAP